MFFFFKAAATTQIYSLSLHDALPISGNTVDRDRFLLARCSMIEQEELRLSGFEVDGAVRDQVSARRRVDRFDELGVEDRKSTRLNSSHVEISYAVFCLKKKKETKS